MAALGSEAQSAESMPFTQFLQHAGKMSEALSSEQCWAPFVALDPEHTTEGARERLPCLTL